MAEYFPHPQLQKNKPMIQTSMTPLQLCYLYSQYPESWQVVPDEYVDIIPFLNQKCINFYLKKQSKELEHGNLFV